MLDHARDSLGLPIVIAIVSYANDASIGLLEKLGLSSDGVIRLPGDDTDVLLYRVAFGA